MAVGMTYFSHFFIIFRVRLFFHFIATSTNGFFPVKSEKKQSKSEKRKLFSKSQVDIVGHYGNSEFKVSSVFFFQRICRVLIAFRITIQFLLKRIEQMAKII